MREIKKLKIYLLTTILSISMLLSGCEDNMFDKNTNVKESLTSNAVVETLPFEVLDNDLSEKESLDKYTLKRNFSYYQGEEPMSKITSITFSHIPPSIYDEKWFANITDSNDVVGYRKGTEIFIVGDEIFLNPSSKYLFAKKGPCDEELWGSLKEINGLELLDTSLSTDMGKMFQFCTFLTELDLSNWDVSNVKSMKMMFNGCTNLEIINVANWNVGNVEDFTAMFQSENSNNGNMKLKQIDVSKWDMSSAKDVKYMFYGCGNLASIDVSNWDVSNVRNFSHMFADCYNLSRIDISNWNSLSVKSFDALLNDCKNLETIDVSNLKTSTCRQFSQMFEDCVNLKEIIGIEDWDVSNASYYAFSEMFHGCKSLRFLDLSSWDTKLADNMARMFCNCTSLEYLNIENFDMSNLETDLEMFKNCPKLKEIGQGKE